jgi:hypothetical protein
LPETNGVEPPGVRELRQYIDSNLGTEMLDPLFEEAKLKIAEVKRNVMQ